RLAGASGWRQAPDDGVGASGLLCATLCRARGRSDGHTRAGRPDPSGRISLPLSQRRTAAPAFAGAAAGVAAPLVVVGCAFRGAGCKGPGVGVAIYGAP